MAQELPRVLRWLQENKRVSVPDDWLEACVEWVLSENEGHTLSFAELCSAVYEQWLVADLCEIGASCLPAEVATDPKHILTGFYSLQINSITEVSHSFYSQLQKVTGTENANVLVTSSESTQRPTNQNDYKNDVNGGRMLMMVLTDGVVNMKGMEYRPIPSLGVDMAAGLKILVHGTVLCRCGVMMLTADNVHVLGGEVESLADAARPETLISTNLGRNVQLCETRPDLPRANFDSTRKNSGSLKQTTGSKTSLLAPTSSRRDCNLSSINVATNVGNHLKANVYDNEDDMNVLGADNIDFSDDDDILISSTLGTECFYPPKMDLTKQETVQKSVCQPASTVRGPFSSVRSMSDGHSGFSAPNSHYEQRTRLTHGSASEIIPNKCESDTMDFEDDYDKLLQNCVLPDSNRTTRSSLFVAPDCDQAVNIHKSVNAEKSVASKLSSQVQEIKPFGKFVSIESRGQNEMISVSTGRVPSSARPIQTHRQTLSIDKSENRASFDGMITNQQTRILNSSALQQSQSGLKSSTDILLTSIKLEPKSELGSSSLYPSANRGVASNNILNEAKYKTMDSTSMKCDSLLTDVNTNEPFTYISLILLKKPLSGKVFRVKAYVATLLSRLEYNNGRYWSLTVKINDGSSTLDAVISNEMLTSLIGFSAEESLKIKEGKTEKKLRQRLTEGVRQCQETLASMSAILEISFNADSKTWSIDCYRQVTSNDVMALQSRVSRD